ncbi:hypothetical protein C2S52_020756 [Perilla frutescens var. hirtella]|nr:hypothetical protein C2S52_020756 [Perilla frutescens var. hirtella]
MTFKRGEADKFTVTMYDSNYIERELVRSTRGQPENPRLPRSFAGIVLGRCRHLKYRVRVCVDLNLLIRDKDMLRLQTTATERLWHVSIRVGRSGIEMGRGWVFFAFEHRIKPNDVLVFTPTNHGLFFKVTIFTASGLERRFKHRLISSKISNSLQTNMIVDIFVDWITATGLKPPEMVVLQNSEGREWRVGVEQRTNNYGFHYKFESQGWRVFYDANRLRIGDVVEFEYIHIIENIIAVTDCPGLMPTFEQCLANYSEIIFQKESGNLMQMINPHDRACSVFIDILYSNYKERLRMPTCFERVVSNLTLPATLILTDKLKRLWPVTLEELGSSGSSVYFTDGWTNFTTAIELQCGDMLTFDRLDAYKWKVTLYDNLYVQREVPKSTGGQPSTPSSAGSLGGVVMQVWVCVDGNHLLRNRDSMRLQTSASDRVYNVKFSFGGHYMVIGYGWIDFEFENEITKRDRLIFQPTDDGATFMVTVFTDQGMERHVTLGPLTLEVRKLNFQKHMKKHMTYSLWSNMMTDVHLLFCLGSDSARIHGFAVTVTIMVDHIIAARISIISDYLSVHALQLIAGAIEDVVGAAMAIMRITKIMMNILRSLIRPVDVACKIEEIWRRLEDFIWFISFLEIHFDVQTNTVYVRPAYWNRYEALHMEPHRYIGYRLVGEPNYTLLRKVFMEGRIGTLDMQWIISTLDGLGDPEWMRMPPKHWWWE